MTRVSDNILSTIKMRIQADVVRNSLKNGDIRTTDIWVDLERVP